MRGALAALLVVVGASVAHPADGAWSVARRDGGRTGRSTRILGISDPAVRWRQRLGGTLGQGQVATWDVDGDDVRDVLLIAGGRLVARRFDDSLIWESEALGLVSLVAADDFDGDGRGEAIVAGAKRVHVVELEDGREVWATPEGFFGVVGAVRLGDLDNDEHVDLYVTDLGGGNVGALPQNAAAYAIGLGVADAEEMWRLPKGVRDSYAGFYDLVAQIDDDPELEIVAVGFSHLYAYGGRDGRLEHTSPDLGPIPNSAFLAAVPGPDGPLLAAFSDNSVAAPNNSRRVMVLSVEGGDLTRRWEASVDDVVLDRHRFVSGSLVDLDDDGRPEIATSFYDHDADEWRLRIFDAADGTERANRVAGPLAAIVDLDGDGRQELLTWEHGLPTVVWAFDGDTLRPVWTVEGFAPVLVPNRAASRVGASASEALVVSWDSAIRAIVLRVLDDTITTALVAFAGNEKTPVELGRYEVEDGISVVSWVIEPGVTRDYPQALVTRSDGYLAILSDTFRTTNFETQPDIDVPGLRVGGYWSGSEAFGPTALGRDVDADGDEDVFVRDGRGILMRIDPVGASLVEPPAIVWSLPEPGAGALADIDGDGRVEVVLTGREEVVYFSAEDAGERARARVAPPDRRFYFESLPMDLDGDGAEEVGYQVYDPNTGRVETNFLDAAGERIWDDDFAHVIVGGGGGPLAAGRFGLSGSSPVVQLFDDLLVLNGTTGVPTSAGVGFQNAPVIVDDLDGEGDPEIVLSGGSNQAIAYGSDMERLWVADASQDRYMMGSVADCGDEGRVLAQGHYRSPELVLRDGATGDVRQRLVLASGGVWDSQEEAIAGGAVPGFLSSVATSPNDFDGNGPASIVGSTDGYVYVVSTCTGALRHIVPIGYSLGEPILVDVDADGADEIVVSAADGYLYGIGQEIAPPPEWVYETDGTFLATTAEEDLDEIRTEDTLWANWAAVEGATRYEIAVLTSADTFVTDPPFIDVGLDTSVEASGLALELGGRYRFAVRAYAAGGRTSEGFSDGIQVVERPGGGDAGPDGGPDDAGADERWSVRGGGCACRAGGGTGVGGVTSACLGVLLALGLLRTRWRGRMVVRSRSPNESAASREGAGCES